MNPSATALVLGATGGIGGEVARGLAKEGWSVRALHRSADGTKLPNIDGVTWIKGDAMHPHDVLEAADGAEVIVHAVNPPGYRHWGRLVLPMLDNTIRAARKNRARIVLPGTVYNFGPDAFAGLDEWSAQNPLTRKGAIRVAMEHRLEVASGQGARVLIVRAGDFFGPGAANTWFSGCLVKAGRRPRAITYPGRPGVGHQWAFLPDVANTMIRLLAREDRLEPFARFHMRGHWDLDGGAMIAAIRQALGRPDLPVRRFPWGLVRGLAPVVPLFHELAEMRYLWTTPLAMTNTRLVAALGQEPHTPLSEAVPKTLAGLGCL